MPLRDHFYPPMIGRNRWDKLHGQWPAMIVMQLNQILPRQYSAAPQVHLGGGIEIDSRRIFIAKCAALLRQQFSVGIVDVVTTREFNLYAELLEFMDISDLDRSLGTPSASIYVAVCRATARRKCRLVEAWHRPLTIGQTLPQIPIWLADNLAITLDLESSYEETCRVLRID